VSGADIENASASDLCIDGNRAENPHRLNGCRGGGIFLIQAHRVALRRVHVKAMNGDGISFQQCLGTTVEECVCEENAGLGLHPGSGSVGARILRCTCRANGGDGIFYCLRVSFSLCEGCTVTDNGGHGISIGGRDTDHLIRGNAVRANGGCGVYFRPADRVMAGSRNCIEANELAGNCLRTGAAEVDVSAAVCDVHILGNRIAPRDGIAGVRVIAGTQGVAIAGNRIQADEGRAIVIEDAGPAVRLDAPAEALAVGPDAAPTGAARHLAPQ
jgi:hypothetical protein